MRSGAEELDLLSATKGEIIPQAVCKNITENASAMRIILFIPLPPQGSFSFIC
jgi:hypothetical protein